MSGYAGLLSKTRAVLRKIPAWYMVRRKIKLSVRRRVLQRKLGQAVLGKDGIWQITIHPGLLSYLETAVLVHELAHVVAGVGGHVWHGTKWQDEMHRAGRALVGTTLWAQGVQGAGAAVDHPVALTTLLASLLATVDIHKQAERRR